LRCLESLLVQLALKRIYLLLVPEARSDHGSAEIYEKGASEGAHEELFELALVGAQIS
jgi:hypothetical protein